MFDEVRGRTISLTMRMMTGTTTIPTANPPITKSSIGYLLIARRDMLSLKTLECNTVLALQILG